MNEEAYFEQIFQAIADWFNETNATESERELLTATLYGGTDGETQLEADSFGFAYPDYPDDHLGIGSAWRNEQSAHRRGWIFSAQSAASDQ